MINRRLTGRTFHHYLNPERDIDPGAQEVHGLSREFLSDKPLFGDVADEFLEFVGDAELVIHNAPFDVGFLDAELTRLERDLPAMQVLCPVLDTLVLAREMHPGQRNSLDALCRRYQVDNSQRELHGALLDARILAEVYLAMTGGQAALSLGTERKSSAAGQPVDRRIDRKGLKLVVVRATDEELAAHEAALDRIEATGKGEPVWRNLER
jgi:DNA polymerase-3 subunit epsilon